MLGYGKGLAHGLFLGRPSRALKVPYALLAPRGVTGGVHQPGSEFKRLSLQGGVSCGTRSSPGAHRTHSIPWAQRVCPRAHSVPWAHRVRSRARSVPWAHRVRPRAHSVPWAQSPPQSPLRSVSCLLLMPCALLSIVCPLPSCYLIIVSVVPPVSPSLPSFVSLFSLLVAVVLC